VCVCVCEMCIFIYIQIYIHTYIIGLEGPEIGVYTCPVHVFRVKG